MDGMKVHIRMRSGCGCGECAHLMVYPEMPCLDPPKLDDVWRYGNRAEWTVACHWLGPLSDGRAVLIRRGMRTDGASIPQAAQSVVGGAFQMPLLPYALEHDAAYAGELFGRSECDGRLLANMVADGHVGWMKRNAVWSAVRAGGWAVWGGHNAETVARARLFASVVGEEEWHALEGMRRLFGE